MTQSSTSHQRLSSVGAVLSQDEPHSKSVSSAAQGHDCQPVTVHPNFNPALMPPDPARALTDIPEPARRVNRQLRRLYGKTSRPQSSSIETASQWQLVASQPFAEHLELLQAARLMVLPDSFYKKHNPKKSQPLLTPLTHLQLLDLAEITRAIAQLPRLTRYGILGDKKADTETHKNAKNHKDENLKNKTPSTFRAIIKQFDNDELLSAKYADDWQVILQPQQFEAGEGSLATDIMACSVAVHALQQSNTRKSINQRYSASDICEYVRHYVLSQVLITPAQRYAYRQIRVFEGHIIVAAIHLGWQLQVCADGQCYFNLSSRSSLLTRYANMQDFIINDWQT